MKKKRYSVVGVSNRAMAMFMDPIRDSYCEYAELVSMLDSDIGRMRRYNFSRKTNIPTFTPDEFEKMVERTRPDVVIVACRDADHHTYVIKALELGLDVICEKPLTIDPDKCAAIYASEQKSRGKITVTFNYRYAPHARKIRELIEDGRVGEVVSVDLNWYLDTYHGSSYFQRWNRLRSQSGTLAVHKSCHHFDLVSWWINAKVDEVFAYGTRNFYGPNGALNPLPKEKVGDGRTCVTCDERRRCPYFVRWRRNELRTPSPLESLKIDDHIDDTQEYDNYSPRRCVFDPEIDVEDTYAATMRFDNGAFLSYSLNGSLPYEGFHLAINGTKGRIECDELHALPRLPYDPAGIPETPVVTYFPLFGGRERIDVVNLGGGHGGGDPLLRDELFIGPDPLEKIRRQATLTEAIEAVLTGSALRESVKTGTTCSLAPWRRLVFESH